MTRYGAVERVDARRQGDGRLAGLSWLLGEMDMQRIDGEVVIDCSPVGEADGRQPGGRLESLRREGVLGASQVEHHTGRSRDRSARCRSSRVSCRSEERRVGKE